MDCGPLHSTTTRVLLARCEKYYQADLITPVEHQDASLWDRSGKVHLFRAEALLGDLPPVIPSTLSAIFCWHLFDLVPRDAVPDLALRFHQLLHPGGVLFCLLREPRLEKGADPEWRLENLTDVVRIREGVRTFAYPALTNRDLDRLMPTGSIKTFLRREVLAIK